MAGKKGRSGPKSGNMNGLKNGSRINRQRLVIGNLPVAMVAVQRESRAYRKSLEDAIVKCKGEVTLLDCHIVDAATACTTSAAISRWLLRNRYEEMSVQDIRATNKEMRDAKAERARIVKTLELDARLDPWAQLYGQAEDEQDDEGEIEERN